MGDSIREERDPDKSNHSRRRTDRQRNWLLIPLVFLLLMIAAALFFVIRFAVRSFGGRTQPTEPAVTTTAPDPSYSTEYNIPGSSAGMTEASGSDVTTPAVTDPTGPAPSIPTPTQPNPGDFHLYTAAEVLPLPDDIERGFFKDVNASDENGS